MRWVDSNGLRYVQFPNLVNVPGLWHAIFTRQWWDGKNGSRSSFNIGFNAGDPDDVICSHRRRMISVVGGRSTVYAHQVHGAEVAIWDKASAGRLSQKSVAIVRLSGDALVTCLPDAALVIQTADCQSVMIVDPVRRVIANVHSGWRGSIANIIGKTVDTMVSRFGCRPGDIFGGIGPSLGPCCAEFKNYKEEIPAHYWRYRRAGDLFDFWRLSIDQLAAAGVPPNQVVLAGICTRCNVSTFFSYRGEKRAAGRFAAVIRWCSD